VDLPSGSKEPDSYPIGIDRIYPAPSANEVYDLIGSVNSYRSQNGLGELTTNSYLMAAAQSQADYLAATYEISSGANGHIGSGGSKPIDRAAAFGYGQGKGILVSENWAGVGPSISASDLVTSSFWADSDHQKTLLDGWGVNYVDIGVGVAKNGLITYYVLDVGVVDGDSSYTAPSNSAIINGTQEVTVVFTPLITSTPHADGSVVHVVKAGETLYAIAKSYGVNIDDIRALNNLADGWTLITEGEKLLIKLNGSKTNPSPVPSGTTTVSTQAASDTTTTPGSIMGTPTLMATYTPRPHATRTIDATSQSTPTTAPVPSGSGPSSKTLGLIILIVCGIGLLAVVGVNFIKIGK
jgi:LysM repeat protein